MANTKFMTIRFNLDNPLHSKAWEYLQNLDGKEFKSYSDAATKAISGYFDRFYSLKDDPFLETRRKEDDFVNQIIKAVKEKLSEVLPQFMLSCLVSNAMNQFQGRETIEEAPSEPSEIDWDFLGDD